MGEKVDNSRRQFIRFASGSIVVVALAGVVGYLLPRLSRPVVEGVEVPDTQDNEQLCICPECPTYTDTPLTGGTYCAKGKAQEEAQKLGCICSVCPVSDKYSLKTGYFCIKGKSIDISQ